MSFLFKRMRQKISFLLFLSRREISAFTLIELLMVVVVLSLMAAFVIPNYRKTIEHSVEKSAIMGLMSIRSAEQIHHAKKYIYWDGGGGLAAIKSNLNINLENISGEITYLCANTSGTYDCTAVYSGGGGWTLRINSSVNDGLPYCYLGACPTCKVSGSGGCAIP